MREFGVESERQTRWRTERGSRTTYREDPGPALASRRDHGSCAPRERDDDPNQLPHAAHVGAPDDVDDAEDPGQGMEKDRQQNLDEELHRPIACPRNKEARDPTRASNRTMSTDAATKRPPRSCSHLHLGSQSAASGVSHAARSDLSSALAAAFSDLPSALSAALVVLALFSEVSSAALVFVSEASSAASLALLEVQVVSGASDSDLDSDLLDAMALTHWPWTPFGPWGQVSRAADATASPCESEFVRVTAPTLARTPAVPFSNTAPATTKIKRTFDIQISSRNETPSPVGKKNQAGAPTTQIEIGGSVPVPITLTRGPLVVLLTRALITCAAVS